MHRPYVLVGVLALLVLNAGVFAVGAFQRVTAPYELGYGEGIVLWQAAHMLTPSQAYHPITEYPFVVCHYPPVFHLASNAIAVVTGDLLVAGRLVSLLSAIGVMSLLGLITHFILDGVEARTRLTVALIVAMLPTTLPTFVEWAPQMRVDMLALLWTMLAVFICLHGRHRHRDLAAASVCFVLAVFTKQTFVAAPAACVLVAGWSNRRRALSLTAWIAAMGVVGLTVMQLATGGEFVNHLFVYNQNSFSVARAIFMIGDNMRDMLPVFALAIVPVVTGMVVTRPPAARDHEADQLPETAIFGVRILLCYFVLAFMVSWTSGKFGSASNYFFEWNLAGYALAGVTVALAFGTTRGPSPTMPAVALAVVLGAHVLGQFAFGLNRSLRFTAGARQQVATRVEESKRLVELFRATSGPVFSYDMLALMLAGKDVPLEPAVMFDLARTNRWNPDPFVAQIRQRYFALIVGTSDFSPEDPLMPASVRQAIDQSYGPAEQFGIYRVHRPTSR